MFFSKSLCHFYSRSSFYLILIFLSLIVSDLKSQQEDTYGAIVEPGPKVEDIYGPDGSYKNMVDGKVRISGFYKNKIKHGEFKYYNHSDYLEKTENYKDGVLDGPYAKYSRGKQTYFAEYKNGKKIKYEYEFNANGDTTLVAGPYKAENITEEILTVKQNIVQRADGQRNEVLNYDTLYLKPNQAVYIKHHTFIKTNNEIKDHQMADVSFYGAKSADYSNTQVTNLLELVKSFRRYFPMFQVGEQKALTRWYYPDGTPHFVSDSGYVIRYNKTGPILKDSITASIEKKISQVGYDRAGRVAIMVRYDTSRSNYTTNLYYGANNRLLYEVGSRRYKPTYVKIHDDSVKKASANNVLFDLFGTAYVFDANKKIDTSFSSQEYKLRLKNPVKDGRYFYLPSSKRGKKEFYKVLEIKGNKVSEYSVDSTLKAYDYNAKALQMFQKDSLLYFVKEIPGEMANRYNINKFVYKNDKFYTVHNRIKPQHLYYRAYLVEHIQKDSIPVFKSELLSEKEFKKALDLKPISSFKKKELMALVKKCKEIIASTELVAQSIKTAVYESYDLRNPYALVAFEFYKAGYNPYFTREDLDNLIDKLELDSGEKREVKSITRG